MTIGQQIRIMRTNKGVSQKDLAKKAGISASYLCDIEMGRSNCSVVVLQKIAEALSVDFATLLSEDGGKK